MPLRRPCCRYCGRPLTGAQRGRPREFCPHHAKRQWDREHPRLTWEEWWQQLNQRLVRSETHE